MRRETVQRIVVRGPNWLGDAVMCEPALSGVRRIFPQASLTLLVKPAVAELFANHPAIDRIMPYEDRGRHAGFAGKWRLAGELRGIRFDLAVLFQNAFEAALLTCLAGIPRRYGYATDGRSLFLSDPVARPDRRKPVHQVQYYWDLLKPLGLTGDPSQPKLFLSAEEERSMAERLATAGIAEADIVIGINPGSTYGGAKRWLPDRFAESTEQLCRRLNESGGRRTAVVILGAKGEERLGREIAAHLYVPHDGPVRDDDDPPAHGGGATVRRPDHQRHWPDARCVGVSGSCRGHFRSDRLANDLPLRLRSCAVRHAVDCAPCMLRECPIDHRCMTGVSVDQVSRRRRN